jgi:hypothetical protein
MFYNLLEFPEAPPTNRIQILKEILDVYSPDLFMVCELQSEIGADDILINSLQTVNKQFRRANFVLNKSSDFKDLQQLVFYNSEKLILDDQSEIITRIRDINHYIFRVNTINIESNPIYLDVFVGHLKSSQGVENEKLRSDMAFNLTNALESISPNHYVLFSGDFNFYTANEDGYQELLDATNAIVLKDPINNSGSWHNNINFQNIHTQATRTLNSEFDNFGATGGLDDRFDFILISENLLDDSTLRFVTNSYQSYGNNGNCFNNNISSANCSGIKFSQSLRNNLYKMSDHLPVVLQLETDHVLNLSNNLSSNRYIQIKNGNIITNSIVISVNDDLHGENILIFDSIGRIVKSYKINESERILDLSFLSNGIYYLIVENSYYSFPLKFIKL